MTHQPIFYEIAEAYATPYEERTETQIELTWSGLCWAYGGCELNDRHSQMQTIFGGNYYWLPARTQEMYTNSEMVEYDNLRCIAALFFAAMSDKDFNQMMEGE